MTTTAPGTGRAEAVTPIDLQQARGSGVSSGDRLREFARNKPAVVGAVLLLCLIGFCFLGPVLYHTDQIHTNILAVRLPPSGQHLLGTDDVGYDELGRLMAGGQSTLEIGVGAGLFASLVGIVWGAIAGYFGGIVDAIMMRVVDGLLSIPTFVLLIVLATIVQPSVGVLTVILGSISWLVASRLVRAEALTLKTRLYMQAFRSYGGRTPRALA
ncbi:MAG: ABC transporter permease, partial [Nitrososphaerales archaeon]